MTLPRRAPVCADATLLPDPEVIDRLGFEALVELATQLAAMLERVRARLALHGAASSPSAAAGPERLLAAGGVAARLGVSQDYVYRQAPRWPFTRRIGRAVRFSEAGFERWLAARRPND